MAWGPKKGYKGGGYSVREAAKRAAARGYEWVVLILDDSGDPEYPEGAEIAEFNRQLYPEWVQINREEGLLAGCWFTQGGNLNRAPLDSDLAIAECEGPGDLEGINYVIAQGQLPHNVPVGVITNFSTLTRDNVKPMLNAGFTCLPEAYMNELDHMTPDNMDRVARSLGWPTSQPTAGMYPVGGNPVPSYAEWDTEWPLADYLLEHVI